MICATIADDLSHGEAPMETPAPSILRSENLTFKGYVVYNFFKFPAI